MPSVSIFTRLREVAALAPKAPALLIDGTAYSYQDLIDRIERCAAGLAQAGVSPSHAVAVAFPNSLEFVVAAFATFALDAVLVPLNPQFKSDELQHCLHLSRPTALLYPPAMQSLLGAMDVPGLALRASSIEAISAAQPGEAQVARRQRAVQPVDAKAATGIYMFSSGSTGKSKRVTRTQGQLLGEYFALQEALNLQPSDRILGTVPLFHAHGFCNTLLAALLSGAQLVLLTSEFNPRATVQTLAEQHITIYPAVPFMFKVLADTHFPTLPNLTALRLVFSAGATLPEGLSQRFHATFSKPLSQLYGSTETGAVSINSTRALEKPTSVGQPLPGTHVSIRDETGTTLPAGEPGEIWIAAATAATAYDGLADLSAACFVNGAFFSGDLGYLDAEGDLFITGRKKLLINVAGYKVDPLEVEQVLARHPQVSDVVVVGVAHSGASEKIKAIVVAKLPLACSEQELIAFASLHLANYKVPKMIEFRAAIPKNELGKVLREQLTLSADLP